MPFQYFGGKKTLARRYPAPRYDTIVEPFAGSAGYALWHWSPGMRVVLVERDPDVVDLWRRLQAPDAEDRLLAIDCPPVGTTTNEPFVLLCQGGVGGVQKAISNVGRHYTVTSRMAREWYGHRGRLIAALPAIREWEIIAGDYTCAPDIEATWSIDPPYWTPPGEGSRGMGYRYGSDLIDFDALARWCKARRGQAIVCEQAGATWLPFRTLTTMGHAGNAHGSDAHARTEAIWENA